MFVHLFILRKSCFPTSNHSINVGRLRCRANTLTHCAVFSHCFCCRESFFFDFFSFCFYSFSFSSSACTSSPCSSASTSYSTSFSSSSSNSSCFLLPPPPPFFFFFSLHDSSSSLPISLASRSVGAQDEAACQRSAGSPLAASPLMLLLPLFLCSLGSVALLQLLDAARVPVLLPCLRFFVFVNPASSSRSIRPSFRPPACHFLPFPRRHSLGVAWC